MRPSCMQSKVTFAVLDGAPWSCPRWFVEMNEWMNEWMNGLLEPWWSAAAAVSLINNDNDHDRYLFSSIEHRACSVLFCSVLFCSVLFCSSQMGLLACSKIDKRSITSHHKYTKILSYSKNKYRSQSSSTSMQSNVLQSMTYYTTCRIHTVS